MTKIKISHEAPISIMNEVQQLTDYDYCLPHLMDQNEEYKKFFLDAKEKGREIYLDNSLHEIGRPYEDNRLFYWLDQIQPQEFFIPDYWEDQIQSIVSAKKWIQIQEQFPNTTFIAVIQAKSYSEALECYSIYKDLGYKKIAFSYGAEYYADLTPHPNKNIAKALGRIQVISKLYKEGIILDNDKVHLLGTCFPQEFGFYKDFSFIESIDTSSPVMSAIEGIKYTNFGLEEKPIANMNSVFNLSKEEINLELVEHNILKFKAINNL